MHKSTTNLTNKLIFPELSYLIMGVLFEVHNKLGNKFQEKHYQRAIESKLASVGIKFKKEVPVQLTFEGKKLGDFRMDFLIDDKIILETKYVWRITQSDVKQVLRYQQATGLKLAIIANFRHKTLEYRRVVY